MTIFKMIDLIIITASIVCSVVFLLIFANLKIDVDFKSKNTQDSESGESEKGKD